MNWRPKDWSNPYKDKAEAFSYQTVEPAMHEAFEDGADAMHKADVKWLEKRIQEGYDHQRGGVRTLIIELDPLEWKEFKEL